MLIGGLVRTPGTVLHRELSGDEWTLDQHLLAVVADLIAQGNWQRQGKKGAKRPDPISPLARKRREPERFGNTDGRSPEEVMALLHAYRTGAFERG